VALAAGRAFAAEKSRGDRAHRARMLMVCMINGK
jgi:hypothetical protein